MGLTEDVSAHYGIASVKRVTYWDSRYYKILYEAKQGKRKQLMEDHFPSVTEILGVYPNDFIAKWRGDVGNDKADQVVRDALQLGSFIHFGAECIARGGAVILNPVEAPVYSEKETDRLRKKYKTDLCICRFQKEFVALHRVWQFFMAVKPTDVQCEQTVYSIRHKYAGTLDVFAKVKGGSFPIAGSQMMELESGWWLWDYKTGKSTSHQNKLQLSAYIMAVLEGRPDLVGKLKGGMLLHTNAQTKEGIEGFKATRITVKEAESVYFPQFLKVYDVYKIASPVPTPKEFSMPSLLTLSNN